MTTVVANSCDSEAAVSCAGAFYGLILSGYKVVGETVSKGNTY